MTAEISTCGSYRYLLTRKIGPWPGPGRIIPALFIMLNPSTADAVQDDPTIRRCISFAEREWCTDLTVVNLFALRATNPKDLVGHPNPVGPLNDQRIAEMIEKHKNGIIIAAWGSHSFAEERAKQVIDKFGPFMCLGKTKNGSPRHPLYLKSIAPLIEL